MILISALSSKLSGSIEVLPLKISSRTLAIAKGSKSGHRMSKFMPVKVMQSQLELKRRCKSFELWPRINLFT